MTYIALVITVSEIPSTSKLRKFNVIAIGLSSPCTIFISFTFNGSRDIRFKSALPTIRIFTVRSNKSFIHKFNLHNNLPFLLFLITSVIARGKHSESPALHFDKSLAANEILNHF